ncbi:MAG: fused response regulator/phosphatase [Chromatiales bacterium]|nr:fused response regulator/phosphatase [Chromatiales bacterium]
MQAILEQAGVVDESAIRVLVVDDNRTNRMVLTALLKRHDYEILSAENGQQAVELFERERPVLVLMDVMMPVMDGYEATRQIKKLAGEVFVPVIFVTALTDEGALVKCIEAGGDDFLSKPYNRTVLKAKIDALMRLREAYTVQLSQRRQLAYHQKHAEDEQRVAERLFAGIVHTGALDDSNIRYSISPMAIFNGDLLLAANTPSGALHIMLGDFTGHGLAASIGALPASEIFYGMTAKGFGIGDIVTELNKKLKNVLPTGLFLATALLELNFATGSVTVWNGGLPDPIMYNPQTGIVTRFRSRHVPIGIMDSQMFDRSVELFEMHETDRIFMYTDGVTEALNPAGEMFGQDRLESFFEQAGGHDSQVDQVTEALEVFREGGKQGDDITLIQIFCRPADAPSQSPGAAQRAAKPPAQWNFSFEFGPHALRNSDPLPMMVNTLMETQGIYDHRERLYTVLAELFSNSLDHGLLSLDSALKKTPEGFMQYYAERQQKLEKLEEGRIRVMFHHRPHGKGGRLEIEILDSGPGYAVGQARPELAANTGHSGRGIPLVRSLCKELIYNPKGNAARALYEWD